MALTNKVIVVTGGAGLLGTPFIKSIVQNRGIGIIADINVNEGRKITREISGELNTNTVFFSELDITSKKSVQACIKRIKRKYGKIDALVNNAYPRNPNWGRDFLEVDYVDFCDNVNKHLGGYFLVSQQFTSFFLEQGFGNIVNIASIYGVIPPRFELYEDTNFTMPVEYAVIKSGIVQMTKYLAKYLKRKNIRVNCISPGGIFDNQPKSFVKKYQQLSLNKGMLDKNDVSGLLIFLLSDDSQYINGQNIIIDDGFTL